MKNVQNQIISANTHISVYNYPRITFLNDFVIRFD